MNTDKEDDHCHRPNCSWLSLPLLTGIDPPQLTANPELSGIGVILGFSITAYITVALLVFHYITVYDPHNSDTTAEECANPVDHITVNLIRKHLISWKPTRRFEYAMEKSVLLLSDTQLVTGVAILIAGFSQLSCGISAYHWQVIVYIAWFSSFTFLAAVAFLKNYFLKNKSVRVIRLFFMCALSGLQIAALLPTGSKNWLDVYGQQGHFYPSLSAECYYKQLASPLFAKGGPRVWSMVVSVLIIGVSYVRCGIRLYNPTTNFGHTYLGRVGTWYKQVWYLLEKKASQKGRGAALWILPCLAFYAIFCNVCALVDIARSTLGEILWLGSAIAWGSIKLWRTRLLVQLNSDTPAFNTTAFHARLSVEDEWSFGQTLPLILLLLPILSMAQSFLDNDAKRQDTVNAIAQRNPDSPKKNTADSSSTRLSQICIASVIENDVEGTVCTPSRHNPSPNHSKHKSSSSSPKTPISTSTLELPIPFSTLHDRSILPQLPRHLHSSFASSHWYTDHIFLQVWQIIMLVAYILIIQDVTTNILGVSFLFRSRVFLLWVFVCIPLASYLHLAFWYAAATIVNHTAGAEDWLNGTGSFAYKGDRKFWLWRVTWGQWMGWAWRTALKVGLLSFTFFVSQELAGPENLAFGF